MASTPVVTLERFRPCDVDPVVAWLMDERIAGNMNWDTCKSREEALRLLNYDILLRPWCRVFYVDGKGPAGIMYAKFFSGVDACRAEIGAFVAPEYWNRGVFTVGLKVGVADLLNRWPQLERIEAQVYASNAASEKGLLKAGFRREGVLWKYTLQKGKPMDTVIFSFLRPRPAKL